MSVGRAASILENHSWGFHDVSASCPVESRCGACAQTLPNLTSESNILLRPPEPVSRATSFFHSSAVSVTVAVGFQTFAVGRETSSLDTRNVLIGLPCQLCQLSSRPRRPEWSKQNSVPLEGCALAAARLKERSGDTARDVLFGEAVLNRF